MRASLFLGLLATPSLVLAADANRGASLYKNNCVACHGVSGVGDGPASAALRPPPRSFQDPEFWKERTDDALKATIRGGRPGTAMMAFGQLSDEDLGSLVTYLRTMDPKSKPKP